MNESYMEENAPKTEGFGTKLDMVLAELRQVEEQKTRLARASMELREEAAKLHEALSFQLKEAAGEGVA